MTGTTLSSSPSVAGKKRSRTNTRATNNTALSHWKRFCLNPRSWALFVGFYFGFVWRLYMGTSSSTKEGLLVEPNHSEETVPLPKGQSTLPKKKPQSNNHTATQQQRRLGSLPRGRGKLPTKKKPIPQLPIESPSSPINEYDPTDPKNAVHKSLHKFVTVGGVLYEPSVHYNCTKTNGQTITLPRLPTFLIVGAQKGGTSALHALLSKHKRIVRSNWFETHFFDQHPSVQSKKNKKRLEEVMYEQELVQSYAFQKGKDHHQLPVPPEFCNIRDTYAQTCFDVKRIYKHPALVTYEKTPAYIMTQGLPRLLRHVVPWSKIIISLRNPVDRAFSNFKMMVERTPDKVNVTFEQILAKDLAVLRSLNYTVPDDEPFERQVVEDAGNNNATRPRPPRGNRWKFSNYLYRSLYADQLKPWLRHYDLGKNLLVLQYERLNQQPDVVLSEILDFLQIADHDFSPRKLAKNYSPRFWATANESDAVITAEAVQKLVLHNNTRAYLERLFAPYNKQLAQLLTKAAADSGAAGQPNWTQVWQPGTSRY